MPYTIQITGNKENGVENVFIKFEMKLGESFMISTDSFKMPKIKRVSEQKPIRVTRENRNDPGLRALRNLIPHSPEAWCTNNENLF